MAGRCFYNIVVSHVLGISEFKCLRYLGCVVHKWLESLWIPLLETHLSTYGKLDLAIASSLFHCSLVMYRCTCHMAPSCLSIGTPFSWYGVVWAMCICGLGVGLVMFVPSLASWLTISLHVIPMCVPWLFKLLFCGWSVVFNWPWPIWAICPCVDVVMRGVLCGCWCGRCC